MRHTVVLALLCASCGAAEDDTERAFLAGLSAYEEGDLIRAKAAFEDCIALDARSAAPQGRTDCMTNLASVIIDLGEEDSDRSAELLYRSVLDAEPNHADAAYNLALQLQDRKTSEALKEAADLYHQVAKSDPRRWDAWANLAAALKELNVEPLATCTAFQRAIFHLEKSHEESSGDEPPPQELVYLASLYYGLGLQLSSLSATQCQQYAADPESLMVGVQPDGSSDGSNSVCLENAQNALRITLDLQPDHVQAEHMLASLISSTHGGSAPVAKASSAFVRSLFDDFSSSFDEKLADLQYAVPTLVGAAARAFVHNQRQGMPFASALDAGCGTGLAGVHLRALVDGPMAGVDLSQKMLDRAAALTVDGEGGQPLYDKLLAKDLVYLQLPDVLPRQHASIAAVELVTAADVFVYFGALEELMGTFARLGAQALIFSCERATTDEAGVSGWVLRSSGRFAHTREYVEVAAASSDFHLVSYSEIVPRYEYGQPIAGHLFVFQRRR